jgi:hypothetical protein
MWALRRVEQHPSSPICRQELWKETKVYHPFDIIGCLLLKDTVEVAFILFTV